MDKERFSYVGKQLALVCIVLIVGVLIFALGLMIGYGVIGDGDNVFSILSPEKWHILFNKLTGK